MALASETLLPSVLILVALPPLNVVAIAAVGVSETPAASPASLRAEALETLLPESVPRSVTVYCCAALGAADVQSQNAAKIKEIPDLLVAANNTVNPGVRTPAILCMFLKVMTAPCGRLEGSQNPCRHSGSGQVIDRGVSIHGIVVRFFSAESVNQWQSLLVSQSCRQFVIKLQIDRALAFLFIS
jgi:hypothetical protein